MHESADLLLTLELLIDAEASNPAWRKWLPSDPTSAHWYDADRLARYMAAHVSCDEDLGRPPRTVREFIAGFRGLSGSAKQKCVLDESGAARTPLSENEFGLRTGASSEISAGTSREVYWHQLVAIGRMSWLHRERDAFNGTPVLVGGGDWLYLAPAVGLSIRHVTIQGEIKLPIYRALANRQLDSARTIQVGLIVKTF